MVEQAALAAAEGGQIDGDSLSGKRVIDVAASMDSPRKSRFRTASLTFCSDSRWTGPAATRTLYAGTFS